VLHTHRDISKVQIQLYTFILD